MQSVYYGPGGLTLILDSAEIFPNDPGAGCPALVELDKYSASYNCALNEGELDCGEYQLSQSQVNWLDSMESIVEDFITNHS